MMKKLNFIFVAFLLLGLLMSWAMLENSFFFFVKWYCVLLLLGTIFFPMTATIFKNFQDKGWNFSKVIGLGISGLVFWNLSYLKILKLNAFSCYIVVLVFLLMNLFFLKKNKELLIKQGKKLFPVIMKSELFFFYFFMFWTYYRCFSSGINFETEKYMNYGFLNQLLHCEYLPVEDIWLSGFNVNYYYFGHFLAAFLGKLTFSEVGECFQLFVTLVSTLTAVLPYHICFELGKHFSKDYSNNVIPRVMGIVAALAVSLGGTMYFVIYNFFVPRTTPYYYWEDSRYIDFREGSDDQTINEVVPYSNALGDMHAHHIDTMFSFLVIAILLDLFLEEKPNEMEKMLSMRTVMLGCVLGIQRMTNLWDFVIYLVVIMISFVFYHFSQYHFSKKTVVSTVYTLIEIVLVSLVVSFLFMSHLYIGSIKILLTPIRSPFYQMCVLWGLYTICVLTFIAKLICVWLKEKKEHHFWKQLCEYIARIKTTDLFVFILGCCAIGLILIPEVVYVRDIYQDAQRRSNTVYKLWYEAEILFDIATTYILVQWLVEKKKMKQKIVPIILMSFYVLTFGYGINALVFSANHFDSPYFSSLDQTEKFLAEQYPGDYRAVQWVKQNVPSDAIVVEKTVRSYGFHPVISVFCGNPTILGWADHEWIWRSNPDYSTPEEVSTRWEDVWKLYRLDDKEELSRIIQKYGISYLYVSDHPEDDWKIANLRTLLSLGKIVYEDSTGNGESPIYLIQF